ncbi:MAG: hypothetical protein JNL28_10685 [Planctomycetes bacterium]|nr:hypothetical protein [Planctomycetota bacterium]
MKYYVSVNGRTRIVHLIERNNKLVVHVDDQPFDASYQEVDSLGQVVIIHDGKSYGLSMAGDPNQVEVTLAGHFYDVRIEDERERAAHAAERAGGRSNGLVISVMPGVVVDLMVKPGDRIEKGQALLILSAMKMQNEIGAPVAGIVKELHVAADQAVAAGAKLVTITPNPD